MINVVCGIRSTGRICTDLATALEELGHEVKIAYGRETVPEQFQKYAVRIGTDFDVKMHGVKARLFDGCGFGSRKATVRFIEWVKEYDPDVIHLHNLHGYYINIEVLFNYLRTCGKRIVWTLHDSWAFTGHSAYCDSVNCEKWIEGCHNCPILNMYPKSYFDRSSVNWKHKRSILSNIPNLYIVTPSYWLSNLVSKSFLSQYPINIINNGIDTVKFYPVKNNIRDIYGIGTKKMLLGVSTAWDDMKGLSDFIKLSGLLGDDYKIVLIGLTNEQLKRIPDNIVGINRTNNIVELSQFYSEADMFLNLSYCENYPTVNLEAIACGTPVLTYKTGGSPECAHIVIERGDLNSVIYEIKNYKKQKIHIDKSKLDYRYMIDKYISLFFSEL